MASSWTTSSNKSSIMFSRCFSLMKYLRNTLYHSGSILQPQKHRKVYLHNVSRLHTSRLTNTSHQKHGFIIRESAKGLEKLSPVVVILGWNNSQDKHLKKYSEMFEKRGYGTVRTTASPFNTFFRSGTKVKKTGHQILDVLMEMNCTERPVFFHTFSNGGGAVFFHIMEALTTPGTKYHGKIKITGSIFDSFPVVPEMKSVKIVQKTITGYIGNPIVRGIVWYGLALSIPLVILLDPTVKRFMPCLITMKCDQLVLFSKSDPFAPYLDIKDYISERRKRGEHVIEKCWEKSGHVNHFREHPEEYSRLVYDFIDDCLQKM